MADAVSANRLDMPRAVKRIDDGIGPVAGDRSAAVQYATCYSGSSNAVA